MTEKHMRRRVVNLLKGHDPVSVENPAYPGTPDINYVEGWVELKQVGRWPKGGETALRVKHYTPQQRTWGRRRQHAGGLSYVLLVIDGDWLLMEACTASHILGKANRFELIDNSVYFWPGGVDEKELCRLLTEPMSDQCFCKRK